MTADHAFHREYRYPSGGWLWTALAAPAAAGVLLVVRLVLDEDVPAFVPVAVGALFAALILFAVRAGTGSATIVDGDRITIRNAFSSHATPWPDVQGIEIEINPGAGRGAPDLIVVLYDAEGRRRILPQLNEKNLPDLEGEVEALREVWMLRRGEDWAPVGKAADKIARARRYPRPLVHVAVMAMFLGLAAGVVISLVMLATGMYDVINENPVTEALFRPMTLILAMPFLAYIGTFVIGAIVRRRR